METNEPLGDYPPLLEPGLQDLTLTELRDICVGRFTASISRFRLMSQLEYVIDSIEDAGVPSEIWVDGSFLTEKRDPLDVDIVLFFQARILDSGPRVRRDILKWVGANLREELGVDSFAIPLLAEDQPDAPDNEKLKRYWLDLYGKSRMGTPKGIARLWTRRNQQ